MLRSSPRFWAGTGLFAALLTCGCQQSRCYCSGCNAPTGTGMAAPYSTVSRPLPTTKVAAQSRQALPTTAPTAPVVHASAKIAADAPPRSQAGSSSRTASSQGGIALATAQYGHDPKYHWLVGLLAYSWIEKAWLVRYVPFEEDDRYGGCVTLVSGLSEKQLKPGQIVRVEGHLIDPNSRQLRPAFQVRSIRVNGS